MAKRTYAAVMAEAAIVTAGALLALAAGAELVSRSVVALGLGAAVMGALAVPSLLVLMWGRGRSHGQFMASLGGVILTKFLVVGVAVLVVVTATGLPPLEFVFGLLAGWIVSFTVMALVLHATLERPAARGRA